MNKTMKKWFIGILRKFHLMKSVDFLRYGLHYIKSKHNHRTENLPPSYFIYETYQLDYDKYLKDGKDTALWLRDYFAKYLTVNNIMAEENKKKTILDWGCGPGRVIRNMPELMPDFDIYGADYNEKYIDWNKQHIQNVKFYKNNLTPPLPFKEESFDIIYAISVFTHLSEENHFAWSQELLRVLKKGGIIFLTLHGDAFKDKLLKKELQLYDAGKLVVRDSNKEGHRTFAAFQPEKFVRQMFIGNEIVLHEKAKRKSQQDVWIIRKS